MKDPAFLFYSDNFISGTMFFTDEQVGKYIRLLCAQHQHGHLSEKHMLFICKTHDEDVFSKFIKDDVGLYYNVRLEEEITKRKKFTESRRNNASGKKSGKKNNKTCAIAHEKHMHEHMGNENENKNENLFDVFWKAYPKKKSKGDAEKAWKSIKPNGELLSIMLDKLEIAKTCFEWTKDNGQFIPYPATWLRAKGWEDVVETEIFGTKPKPNRFCNFKQRDTDYSQYEKYERELIDQKLAKKEDDP